MNINIIYITCFLEVEFLTFPLQMFGGAHSSYVSGTLMPVRSGVPKCFSEADLKDLVAHHVSVLFHVIIFARNIASDISQEPCYTKS